MTKRVLRLPAVAERTGYSKSTIYRLIELGRFPKAVRLGPNAVAWREEDINRWLASLTEA